MHLLRSRPYHRTHACMLTPQAAAAGGVGPRLARPGGRAVAAAGLAAAGAGVEQRAWWAAVPGAWPAAGPPVTAGGVGQACHRFGRLLACAGVARQRCLRMHVAACMLPRPNHLSMTAPAPATACNAGYHRPGLGPGRAAAAAGPAGMPRLSRAPHGRRQRTTARRRRCAVAGTHSYAAVAARRARGGAGTRRRHAAQPCRPGSRAAAAHGGRPRRRRWRPGGWQPGRCGGGGAARGAAGLWPGSAARGWVSGAVWAAIRDCSRCGPQRGRWRQGRRRRQGRASVCSSAQVANNAGARVARL